jgi:hypothetical protein
MEHRESNASVERHVMIRERLRPIFAQERRSLLLGHMALALALVPIPMIRTGWIEAAIVLSIFPPQMPEPVGLYMLIAGTVVSLPVIPLFLAWSLPGANHAGLPKRSIGALCLLIVYHPFRIYLEGKISSPKDLEWVAQLHDQLPIIWALKHLDTPLLLGLALWAIHRRSVAQPKEKIWFHWLLLVGALWAIISLSDSGFGFLVPYIFADPHR